MTPGDTEAIEAFERLGLTTYEARVFIALHQLGVGTAKEIADTAGVPRSQIYSTAESLEGKGLLDIQQSNPLRYRAVSIDEAQRTLRDQFEREQERAFEYVETVRQEGDEGEEQEDVWTVRGSDRVGVRVVDVLSEARERIVLGVQSLELVTEDIEQVVQKRAREGLDVTVISNSLAVRERFHSFDGITTVPPSEHQRDDNLIGRIVIVDDDSILLSVVSDDGHETAIWSANAIFASVLIQLTEAEIDSTEVNRRTDSQ